MRAHDLALTQSLLIALFAAFYFPVEVGFWLGVSRFGPADFSALVVISFLNLIPAGLFAFTVVSLLPARLRSRFNERALLERTPVGRRGKKPRVAVLYTTYNDFMFDHAEYDVLEAHKAGLPFFILDDSSDPLRRHEVDAFARQRHCRVIRRESRAGYKAGAINRWVERFGGDFDYFFILDSDSRVSWTAIQYCVELARCDPQIAVVQSKTLTMTSSPSRLTSSAVTFQHAYMEVVQRAMRNLGTSPYYGHNALIKIDPLRSVGGFVEETNEDYKTLSLIHDAGYRSLYAEHAVTWEEVPPDYFSSRKRALRWARDAVSQLRLLKPSTPIPIAFFLFYGWVTHMSNLAILGFISMAVGLTLAHLFSGSLIGVVGSITLALIVLWPLAAVRIRDPELTLRKMGTAMFWGSVYNIPMIFPLSLQIIRTTVSKTLSALKALLGVKVVKGPTEELVVTPKRKDRTRSLSSLFSRLKAEVLLGFLLMAIGIGSGHAWSLLFAMPQILSALSLPWIIRSDQSERGPVERDGVFLANVPTTGSTPSSAASLSRH